MKKSTLRLNIVYLVENSLEALALIQLTLQKNYSLMCRQNLWRQYF